MKVGAGETAVHGDMLLPANAIAQGREHSERHAGAEGSAAFSEKG